MAVVIYAWVACLDRPRQQSFAPLQTSYSIQILKAVFGPTLTYLYGFFFLINKNNKNGKSLFMGRVYLWEKFMWAVKWWEMKGWSESLSPICVGKNSRNYIQYFLTLVLFTFCTCCILSLLLLTWRIWWAPNNASRWQMGFNLAFKGFKMSCVYCC